MRKEVETMPIEKFVEMQDRYEKIINRLITGVIVGAVAQYVSSVIWMLVMYFR